MRKITSRIILFIGLALAIYFANRFDLMQKAITLIEDTGVWGPVVFIGIYTLTAVLFIPSFFFTFSAGVLFPIPQGTLYALIGTGLGAASALLIGRYLLKGMSHRFLSNNVQFQTLNKILEHKGISIIVLARLTPIFPFMIGNYAFGATSISAWKYGLASKLGTIPSAFVYVYLGSIIGDITHFSSPERVRTPFEWGLLGSGILAAIGLSWYLKKISENVLEKNMENV